MDDLVRTADLKNFFSEGHTTSWSYKLYNITDIVNDTIRSYKTDQFPERHNEALLKKTNLTLKENDAVKKKTNIT